MDGERKGGGEVSTEHRRGLLIPYTFNQDPKVMKLPGGARHLFISILILAAQIPTNGRLTRDQVYSCGAGLRNVGRDVDRLVDAGLLRREEEEPLYAIVDPALWITPGRSLSSYVAQKAHTSRTDLAQITHTSRTYGAQMPHLARTDPALNGHTSNGKTPAQSPEESPRAGPPARTGAPPRAGSFEVPSSTRTDGTPKGVRDAPRSGEGAARPARKSESKSDPGEVVVPPPEGVTLAGAEARNLIRKQIANGQRNNPASTGRPTKFSKYDPDRPTEPITSALFREEEPE